MAGQAGQAIAFDAGTGMPIPEAEASQALAEGRATFRKGTEVHMRDPATGRAMILPAENASKALSQGFSLIPAAEVAEKLAAKAKQEEYGGIVQQGLTVAEGAAGALSFGGTDQLLTGFGAGTAERAEVNPTARGFGEVAGTVGSLFIPGGAVAKGAGAAAKAGQVARLATAAPRALARGAEALGAGVTRRLGGGLGARALGAGVAGAAEGAAYGAGQVVSRAALQDQELTAEMLLGGAAEGATLGGLLGGGIGAAGGLLGKAGSAVSKRLGGGAGKLDDFANREAALAMLGGDKRGLSKILGKGGMDRLDRLGKRARLDTELMNNPEKALTVVNREAADSVSRLQSVQKQMDDAGTRIERANIVAKIDEQAAKAGSGWTSEQVSVGRDMLEKLKPIRARLADDVAGDLTFSEAWSMRKAIDQVIDWDKGITGKQSALGEALIETRQTFAKSLDDAAESLAPELKTAWKKANADYSDMAIIREVMDKRVKKEMSKSLIGSGDTLSAGFGVAAGLATGSTLTGLATGALLGGANRLIKDRGHEFLARAADRLTRTTSTMDGAARKLAGGKLPSPARLVSPIAIPLAERYEQRRQDVLKAQSPQAMQARLAKATEGLEHERGLVTAIHAGIAADTAYLASQLPQTAADPTATLTPGANKPKVSSVDMAKFVAKAEALDSPADVMVDVANGKIDPSAIEALKARRPKIYAEMRKKIMAYAATSGEELPYKQRVALSVAFDFTADPSMRPANMAAIQQAFAPPPETTPQGEPSRPGPQRKIGGVKEAGQAMTLPSERAGM